MVGFHIFKSLRRYGYHWRNQALGVFGAYLFLMAFFMFFSLSVSRLFMVSVASSSDAPRNTTRRIDQNDVLALLSIAARSLAWCTPTRVVVTVT